MNLTTAPGQALLQIAQDDKKYTIVAWHDGDLIYAHTAESGFEMGTLTEKNETGDLFSILDLMVALFNHRPPTFLDANGIEDVIGQLTLRQFDAL